MKSKLDVGLWHNTIVTAGGLIRESDNITNNRFTSIGRPFISFDDKLTHAHTSSLSLSFFLLHTYTDTCPPLHTFLLLPSLSFSQTHTHTHKLSLSHSLSFSVTYTLSISHFSFFLSFFLCHTHTFYHTCLLLSLSLSFSLTPTHTGKLTKRSILLVFGQNDHRVACEIK